MTYRVLVVEDHELWRRHLCSVLEQTIQWQVVGVAADGVEAVQKAEELKPDLILLDVGLPRLDGIQAARRMLAHDPGSRILLVSEHQSLDIAQAALGAGARGYIVKSDTARDLLLAMEAIVEGKRFMSARLAGRVFDVTNDVSVTREMRRHGAGFYSDESSLLNDCARFAEAALNAGTSLIAVLTDSRRDALHQRLRARGIDVDRAIRERRYVPLDVPTLLSRFIVDGRLDEARFWDAASALIMEAARAATRSDPSVAVCGEGAPTLWREGMVDTAIALERLWDDVARTFDVDVFCPYSVEDPGSGEESEAVQAIRAVHSAVHVRR